jgi:hypothetical protein
MYVDSSWLSGSLAIAGRNCVSVKLSSIFVAVFFSSPDPQARCNFWLFRGGEMASWIASSYGNLLGFKLVA